MGSLCRFFIHCTPVSEVTRVALMLRIFATGCSELVLLQTRAQRILSAHLKLFPMNTYPWKKHFPAEQCSEIQRVGLHALRLISVMLACSKYKQCLKNISPILCCLLPRQHLGIKQVMLI